MYLEGGEGMSAPGSGVYVPRRRWRRRDKERGGEGREEGGGGKGGNVATCYVCPRLHPSFCAPHKQRESALLHPEAQARRGSELPFASSNAPRFMEVGIPAHSFRPSPAPTMIAISCSAVENKKIRGKRGEGKEEGGGNARTTEVSPSASRQPLRAKSWGTESEPAGFARATTTFEAEAFHSVSRAHRMASDGKLPCRRRRHIPRLLLCGSGGGRK
ncbi:hypothetical protein B0H14DRAFT_2564707 [Mycena olivaceomarginata]|nr:hypothetical protein B0H14DRAFT_2564707 [Mycena olivaceomarginata]